MENLLNNSKLQNDTKMHLKIVNKFLIDKSVK